MEPVIAAVEAHVFRAPIDVPVANAFGAMTNRPAVFVRVFASDDAWGWGEVFCNFPQAGAEHRAALVQSIFVPLLAGASCRAEVDGGSWVERRIELPGGLPPGYHDVTVEAGGVTAHCRLLAAPAACHAPTGSLREWGLFAPIYALRGPDQLGFSYRRSNLRPRE